MSIFLSAYDTTAGSIRGKTDATKRAIIEALTSKYFEKSDSGVTLVKTVGNPAFDLPKFGNPLYIDKTPYDGVYVDVRDYVSVDRLTGNVRITSPVDYAFQEMRGNLEKIWRTEPASVLRAIGPLPCSAFSAWVSENVARNYGLSPENQYVLTILTAFYFLSLFADTDKPDSSELNKVVQIISRATRASPDKCFEVLADREYYRGLPEFVTSIKEEFGAQVELLNIKTFITALNTSFWISNGAEVNAIGLEHIPTFYSMLYVVIKEDSHRKSRLAEVVKRCPAKNTADDYVRSLAAMVKNRQ